MKIFKKIFSVFCTIFFILSAVFMVSSVIGSSSGEVSNIGGYYVFVVATDSMDPTLKVNDIFIASNHKEPEVDDIVTYVSQSGTMKGQLITHRLVEITEDNMYICQGDKEGAPRDEAISRDCIVSVLITKVAVLSFLYRVLTNGFGFFFLIILPIIGIFIYEIYNMIKKYKKAEEEESKEKLKEKYIEDMKKQLLEELKGHDNQNP